MTIDTCDEVTMKQIVIFFFRYCDVLYIWVNGFLNKKGWTYKNIELEIYCNLDRILISGHH